MTYVLTAEDIAALRSYAIERGPKWKDDLQLDWYNARCSIADDNFPNRGSVLHGLRNNLGPSWLCDFRFAEPINWPNLRRERTSMLRNMRLALSLHAWNNSEEERIRLSACKRELRRRVEGRSNPR